MVFCKFGTYDCLEPMKIIFFAYFHFVRVIVIARGSGRGIYFLNVHLYLYILVSSISNNVKVHQSTACFYMCHAKMYS